ncbi:MAG: AAA family ATPase [Flavisolibacter sp.]
MLPKEVKHPILHLICGLPGSGKTTVAKSIESTTGAIRFCPDEWIKDIWKDKAEKEGNEYRDQLEQLQWKIGKQLLQNSIDIIIEWGTWGKSEREKLRDEAKALNAYVYFYYLNIPGEILKKRILNRNKNNDPREFYIEENEIDNFIDNCFNSFQTPTSEELTTYDSYRVINQ